MKRQPEPSLADALAQLDPYLTHEYYLIGTAAVRREFERQGPWEAAAYATELCEHFEEIILRRAARGGIASELI